MEQDLWRDGSSGESVQQTSDDKYIIVGSTGAYGNREDVLWLIKAGSSGNVLWDKTFRRSGHDLGLSPIASGEISGFFSRPMSMVRKNRKEEELLELKRLN
jgi:hypothetical protein